MILDFNKLTNEQIDLIISRISKKFDDNKIELIDFSRIILAYRKKRFNSNIIKILEEDEILNGKFYYLGKITEKDINLKENFDSNKDSKTLKEKINKELSKDKNDVDNNIKPQNDLIDEDISRINFFETKNETVEVEKSFSLRDNINSMNKLRTSSFKRFYGNGETKNDDILLDNNIKQIESEFSLREIDSRLPSKNLLDMYNFGFVDLNHIEDDKTENFLKERLRKT